MTEESKALVYIQSSLFFVILYTRAFAVRGGDRQHSADTCVVRAAVKCSWGTPSTRVSCLHRPARSRRRTRYSHHLSRAHPFSARFYSFSCSACQSHCFRPFSSAHAHAALRVCYGSIYLVTNNIGFLYAVRWCDDGFFGTRTRTLQVDALFISFNLPPLPAGNRTWAFWP